MRRSNQHQVGVPGGWAAVVLGALTVVHPADAASPPAPPPPAPAPGRAAARFEPEGPATAQPVASPQPPPPPQQPYAPQPAYGAQAGYAPTAMPASPAPAAYGYSPPMLPPPPSPQPAPPPPRASESADWSLGAGLGTTEFGIGGFAGSLNTPRSPALRLSLERRASGDTWLVLNGSLSNTSYDQPVTPTLSGLGGLGAAPTSRDTLQLSTTRVSALLGIRQILVHGLVDFSVSAGLAVAHDSVGGDDPRPDEVVPQTPGSSGTTFGVIGGFAVERELIPALALRLSADVASASISKLTNVSRSNAVTTHTDVSSRELGLTLAPALHLQLYF